MPLQVVIHVGSTAVCTVVGFFTPKTSENKPRNLKIVAVGIAHTDAFFGGRVGNREHLLSAIHKSVREASDMAGLQIMTATLCFASPTMHSQNMFKEVAIQGGGPISRKHLSDVVDMMAYEVRAQNQTVFQSIRQMVFLDDNHVPDDAIGLYSNKISVSCHLMSLPDNQWEQMKSLVEQDSLQVERAIFDGIAGAEYALSDDEKQHGVCYIDLGAGTTKVCVYHENVLVYSCCLDVGAAAVDLDIAKECGIALLDADSFKRNEGSLNNAKHSPGALVIYKKNTRQEKTMLRRALNQVIEMRYRDIFYQVFQSIDKELLTGIKFVIAGGGARIDGLTGFLRAEFGIHARLAEPNATVQVHPDELSNENLALIRKHLQNNSLHTAIGALLYLNSAQFARDNEVAQVLEDDYAADAPALQLWWDDLMVMWRRVVAMVKSRF